MAWVSGTWNYHEAHQGQIIIRKIVSERKAAQRNTKRLRRVKRMAMERRRRKA